MQTLHELLLRVKAGERHISFGICSAVNNLLPQLDKYAYSDCLDALFTQWPENSGVFRYPVPGPDGYNPRLAFLLSKDVWIGEYGAARLRLLDFLIAKTTPVTAFTLIQHLTADQYTQVMQMLDTLPAMAYSEAFEVEAPTVEAWLKDVLGITLEELQ